MGHIMKEVASLGMDKRGEIEGYNIDFTNIDFALSKMFIHPKVEKEKEQMSMSPAYHLKPGSITDFFLGFQLKFYCLFII